MSREEEIEQSWAMHEAPTLASVVAKPPAAIPAWVLAERAVAQDKARRTMAKIEAMFHQDLLASSIRLAQSRAASNNRRAYLSRKR